MAAIGEGDDVEQVPDIGVQTVPQVTGRIGDRQQADAAGGITSDGEPPSREIHRLRLQHPSGHRPGLVQHGVDGLHQSRTAHMHRPRPAMAIAGAHQAGIGLDVDKGLRRQAQQIGGDLGICGFVAHAIGLGADDQRDAAVVLEAQFRALIRRAAGGFEEAGDAHAAAQSPRLARRPTRRETVAIRVEHRVVHVGGKAAAVDGRAKGLLIGKRPHKIAAAEFDRIDRQLAGGAVHQPLDHIIHLRLPGAAIGVNRQGVGEDPVHIHEDGRNDITAAHGIGRGIGGTAWPARRQIGPQIGGGRDIQRQEVPLRIQRQPCLGDVVAALGGAGEILRPFADPCHRTAEVAGGMQQQHQFGIERVLDAKPAADIGGDDADAVGGLVEHAHELIADRMHAGGGEDQLKPIGAERGDRPAILGGGDDEPVVDELHFDHMGRRGQGGLHRAGITLLEPIRQIAGDIVPQPRGIGRQRGGAIHNAGQRLVAHRHRFGPIPRGGAGFSHDEGHGITDMADTAPRQSRPGRDAHRLDRGNLRRTTHQAEMGDIIIGIDRQNPRNGASGFRVETHNPGMRMRRPHDLGPELARDADILNKTAGAGEEAVVLGAEERLADKRHDG